MTVSTEARPAPPPLQYQNPICRLCGEEVEHDGDGWHCMACAAYWSSHDGDEDDEGQWDDDTEPQCASVARARHDGNLGNEHRCLLGETHTDSDDRTTRDHKTRGMVWGRNSWVLEVKPALTLAERDARDNTTGPTP